uniref:Glycoside hydrolase family 65 central catalytic domain-containing protein n=1 Tax=Arion vulgaris TaxID=1028688 RepID=A0A0B7AKW7_9EUPU
MFVTLFHLMLYVLFAYQDYLGHIFWDQDIWMFPPIALLYPDLGRLIVETRTRTLAAAKILARESGFDGARYPWESAFTGT